MRLNKAIESLRSEIRGNDKLQFGLIVVAGLFGLFLIVAVSDKVSHGEKELSELQRELEDFRSLKPMTYWNELSQKGKLASEEIDKKIWSGPSESRIRVQVQSWLIELAKRKRLIRPKIVVAESQSIDGMPGYYELEMGFEATFDGGSFLDFLSTLESGEKHFSLGKLKVSTSPNPNASGRIELIAKTFLKVVK